MIRNQPEERAWKVMIKIPLDPIQRFRVPDVCGDRKNFSHQAATNLSTSSSADLRRAARTAQVQQHRIKRFAVDPGQRRRGTLNTRIRAFQFLPEQMEKVSNGGFVSKDQDFPVLGGSRQNDLHLDGFRIAGQARRDPAN